MEGWLAVTVSGLVSVSLLKPNGALLSASESLSRLRGRVALADIAFTGGGNIVVATTDGSSASPVQFYKVCVSVVSEKCRIDTELLPSLFMRCTTDVVRRSKYPAVTHLKFLTRENSEQVRAYWVFFISVVLLHTYTFTKVCFFTNIHIYTEQPLTLKTLVFTLVLGSWGINLLFKYLLNRDEIWLYNQ